MTQIPSTPQQNIVSAKPQPNIYTVLLIVTLICMAITVAFGLWNLMSSDGYGLGFGDLFSSVEKIISK